MSNMDHKLYKVKVESIHFNSIRMSLIDKEEIIKYCTNTRSKLLPSEGVHFARIFPSSDLYHFFDSNDIEFYNQTR